MALAQILPRRGTSAQWIASNPVLANGEIGYDSTLKRMKIGDGNTVWSGLPWATADGATIQRLEELAREITGAVAPTDAFVASAINNPESATKQALDTTFAPVEAVTAGAEMRKAADAQQRSVVATGHSQFYGMLTGGPVAPANGSATNRSAYAPTTELQRQATYLSPGAVRVVNQTLPGDRTTEALTRWAGGVSGDIEFFWLDINDAVKPGESLSDSETAANMGRLAKRARDRGATFVVIGGTPVQNVQNAHRVFASSETQRAVTERLGGVYIDAGELLNDSTGARWTDGTHLTDDGFSLVGARIAGLLGPKGVHAPTAHPGRIFDWRDHLWVGGALAASAAPAHPGTGGSFVYRVAPGGAMGFAFNVEAPVVPVIKFRTTADAVAGVYTNLDINRAPVYGTVKASGAHVATIVGRRIMSPGPAGIVVRSESGGALDILSVEFVPWKAGEQTQDAWSGSFAPVGGMGPRPSRDWQARIDHSGSTPLSSGAAQTAGLDRKFLFQGTLGATNCGVVLAETTNPVSAFAVANGVGILRAGAVLRVKTFTGGVASDVDVAGVFPASGRWVGSIEAAFVGGDMLIYVDNVLRHTIVGYPFKLATPGILAGAAAGDSFASGAVGIF